MALPAAGRNILGHKATEIFCDALPNVVQQSLLYAAHKAADVTQWCNTVEDTRALRSALKQHKLVAFVGDGAILPRAAGNSVSFSLSNANPPNPTLITPPKPTTFPISPTSVRPNRVSPIHKNTKHTTHNI